MKELTIISGKGGTGKTTVMAALADISRHDKRIILADCDVDASNLPLLLDPHVQKSEEFSGSMIAQKDPTLCTSCGRCEEVCRYGAIDSAYDISPVHCEGCGTCTLVCDPQAITLTEQVTGTVFISQTRLGPLIHADLGIGEEASGKLVTKVRDTACEIAEEKKSDLILIDGSPGIGCPVIASIVGASSILMVTEPTLSGIHDLDRIHQVVNHFSIPCSLLINKCDINMENTARIQKWCQKTGVPLVGMLPYDTRVTESMVSKKTLIEYGIMKKEFTEIWDNLHTMLHV
ncbi:MAG: ATP-binding protein [Theionarchaea archaeon]|nr:ATP-binding protein [Theionarchaea archaeon]